MKMLTFLFLSLLCACTVDVPPDDYGQKVTFSAELGGWLKQDSTGIIFIKTTLYNNTADTLTYLRMDCSWADSYTTDNDSFQVAKTPCYKNGPMTIKLAPHTGRNEYIRLLTKKDLQTWRDGSFRVGYNFHLLDTTKDIVYNVSALTDMQGILWSDTLRLADFWKYR